MNEESLVPGDRKTALVLDARDNVGVALTDLATGDVCTVTEDGGNTYDIVLTAAVPFGHKFALGDLGRDDGVFKYGEEIGRMKEPVARGGWIHSHNMYCDRGMK